MNVYILNIFQLFKYLLLKWNLKHTIKIVILILNAIKYQTFFVWMEYVNAKTRLNGKLFNLVDSFK